MTELLMTPEAIYRREYYAKHKEQVLASQKRRYNPEKAKEYKKHWLERNPDGGRVSTLKWRTINRQKARAQHLASRHVPLKDKCEKCGSTENLMRHHPDYRKPLEVFTYCKECHEKEPPIEEPKELLPDYRYLNGVLRCLILEKGGCVDKRYWKIQIVSTGEIREVYPTHLELNSRPFGHERLVRHILTK